MVCFAIKTGRDLKVKGYVKTIEHKLFRPTNLVSNPIKGKVELLTTKDNYIILVALKIIAFPIYWVTALFLFLYLVLPNKFTLIIFYFSLLFLIPYTKSFWYLLFRLGLRKVKYKGKIKRVSLSYAWGCYLGTN